MEYEHKGIKIEFLESRGIFTAIINDKRTTAPSLPAIKSKIDKAQADTFKPFEAFQIVSDGYRSDEKPDKIKKFNVVGVEKGRRRDSLVFRTSDASFYGFAPSEVTPATPENLAVAAEIIAYTHETAKIEAQRSKHLEKLEAKLVKRKVEDMK